MTEDALSRAIEAIDAFVFALGESLSADDRGAGWTPEGQKAWASYMSDLRAQLLRGDAPHSGDYHIMRGLNFDGIGTGGLADYARDVERRLVKAFPDHRGE